MTTTDKEAFLTTSGSPGMKKENGLQMYAWKTKRTRRRTRKERLESNSFRRRRGMVVRRSWGMKYKIVGGI